MAIDVARARERAAACRTLIDGGFVYPDAFDIRPSSFRGPSQLPVRGTDSPSSSALPHPTPDPGPEDEAPASVSP